MIADDGRRPAAIRFDGEAKRAVVRRPRIWKDGWSLFGRRAAAQSVTLTARELSALFEGRTIAVDVVGENVVYVCVDAAALDAMIVIGAISGTFRNRRRAGVEASSIPQRDDLGAVPTYEERVVAARVRVNVDRQARRPRVKTPAWIVELARDNLR
jgi:hypothetical protein